LQIPVRFTDERGDSTILGNEPLSYAVVKNADSDFVAPVTFDAHQVEWLTGHGFDVFMFDYRGYGESEGSPDRRGVHQDSLAAMCHLRELDGVDPERLLVLGQSLGGCICLGALGDDGLRGVRGIALDGTFGSYRALVNTKMTNTRLTYPLARLIVSGVRGALGVASPSRSGVSRPATTWHRPPHCSARARPTCTAESGSSVELTQQRTSSQRIPGRTSSPSPV